MHTKILIGKTFTPSAPIDSKALFAGRTNQISTLINTVTQRGQHAVLFGERGVGKTSLANILKGLMSGHKFAVASTNCEVASDFQSIWKNIFKGFLVSTKETGMGLVPVEHRSFSTFADQLPPNSTAEDVRHLLEKFEVPSIILIDEIDRISDQQTLTSIADTIKTLSDHSVNTTLILVGVADSLDSLIREHQSIERALVQIQMPRMKLGELRELISKGLDVLGMTMDDAVSSRICRLSNGLPHYTHSLALHSCQAAVDRGSLAVTQVDLITAVNVSISQAQQSIVRSYQQATSSPRGVLYPEVLLACALAKTDELGYFPTKDIRAPLTKLMGKAYDIPAFSKHLNDFCEVDRGMVLQRIGYPRRYLFRFVNPLMEPFVIMKGLSRGKITAEDIDSIND